MDLRKLDDVFNRWLEGHGIFYGLQQLDVPWKTANVNTMLDLEYHGNISGEKFISPLVNKVVENHATDTNISTLASVIFAMNNTNWAKEWATLTQEYIPVQNYNVTEEMSDDITTFEHGLTTTRTDNLASQKAITEDVDYGSSITRTDNLLHTKEGTETKDYDTTDLRTDNLVLTKGGKETNVTTPTTEKTVLNQVKGFNSTSFVDESKTIETMASGTDSTELSYTNRTDSNTGTQTNAKTGEDTLEYNLEEHDSGTRTDVKDGIDTTTTEEQTSNTGTQTNVNSGEDTQTHSYSLSKYGNIGFFTYQSMIKEERDVWSWYYFYNVVFPDIDKILTIQIY